MPNTASARAIDARISTINEAGARDGKFHFTIYEHGVRCLSLTRDEMFAIADPQVTDYHRNGGDPVVFIASDGFAITVNAIEIMDAVEFLDMASLDTAIDSDIELHFGG